MKKELENKKDELIENKLEKKEINKKTNLNDKELKKQNNRDIDEKNKIKEKEQVLREDNLNNQENIEIKKENRSTPFLSETNLELEIQKTNEMKTNSKQKTTTKTKKQNKTTKLVNNEEVQNEINDKDSFVFENEKNQTLDETNLNEKENEVVELKTKKTKNQKQTSPKKEKQEKNIVDEAKDDVLLDVRNLQVSFKTGRKKVIRIVRGVDLKIRRGQIIGLVGESGSGKSVTSKSLLNINEFDITESDRMILNTKDSNGNYHSLDLSSLKNKEWIKVRGKKIGYIPQDPLTSLNPTRTIKKQLLDVLKNDPRFRTTDEKIKFIVELLESFGIRDAINKINSYPHTFSGGMKQRVVIAMVVAAQPDLIIADEPTTALDPTVQASVLTLFENIREKYNISIIFISHNISVIAKFCDYIYVMYAGKVVEKGTKIDIFTKPAHPYTWALISSIPEDKSEKLYNIPGSPPDMANLGAGDPFASRNAYAMEIDFKKEPPLFKITNTHYAATWLLDPRSPKYELSEQLQKRINFFRKVFNIND